MRHEIRIPRLRDASAPTTIGIVTSAPPKTEAGTSGAAGGTRGLASLLPRSMRGYDCAATDQLLAELGSRNAELERACVKLRERTTALEAELARHLRDEQVLSRSLLAATSHAMAMREGARKEAELILRKAREQAAKQSEQVVVERGDAEHELRRLRALTQDVEERLAGFLTEALERLRPKETTPGVQRADGEDQIALLRTLDAALKQEGHKLDESIGSAAPAPASPAAQS